MKDKERVPIKTYTKQELRIKYNITEDTFRRWLNKIKDKIPYYDPKCKLLSPLQVEAIFKHYGEP